MKTVTVMAGSLFFAHDLAETGTPMPDQVQNRLFRDHARGHLALAWPGMLRREPNHARRDWLECFQSVLPGKTERRRLCHPGNNRDRGGGHDGRIRPPRFPERGG